MIERVGTTVGSGRGLCIAAAAALLSACSGDVPLPTAPRRPVVDSASASANVHNVLSASVSAWVSHTDSVVVFFQSRSGTAHAGTSAAVVPAGGVARLPVLGLLPATEYALVAVAFGRAQAASDTMVLTTGALPAGLPSYSASGADPLPGYVVFAAGKYGLVIDNEGRVVWYREFPGGIGLNFLAQPNGRYVARPPTPDIGDLEPWIELDPLGAITRTLTCARGLQPRLHDIIAQPGGDYWLLCDETRTMDLTDIGGVADALVAGSVIQHLGADGALLFEWSTFDHFELTDADPSLRAGTFVNWTHINAIDLDAEGNILASFRNLNEVTKIDGATGAVRWRLGGLRNDFATPVGATLFAGQHSVRALSGNRFVLLDNIGDDVESRVEIWQPDAASRVAQLAWSTGSSPVARTLIGGSVQPLAGGRLLVSYGTSGRVEEYDPNGVVQWRILGNPGYVFRAQRIPSLYEPGVGVAR